MNDKRFTFKLLGIFIMEALNFNRKEIRKTFWHLILGTCLVIAVWKCFGLLEILLKQAA